MATHQEQQVQLQITYWRADGKKGDHKEFRFNAFARTEKMVPRTTTQRVYVLMVSCFAGLRFGGLRLQRKEGVNWERIILVFAQERVFGSSPGRGDRLSSASNIQPSKIGYDRKHISSGKVADIPAEKWTDQGIIPCLRLTYVLGLR